MATTNSIAIHQQVKARSAPVTAQSPGVNWIYTTGGPLLNSPVVGDVDGDDRLEVIVSSGDIRCLNGNGTAKWIVNIKGSERSTPAIADVDGDGKPEIVLAGGVTNMLYCLNGSGGVKWKDTTGDRFFSFSPTVVDIDGDARPEIVIASEPVSYTNGSTVLSRVYCFNGWGAVKWRYDTGGSISSSPTAADVDGDGKLEVLFASDEEMIHCLNCLNASGWQIWNYTAGGSITPSPSIGDIDGDTKPEIIVGYNSNLYCLNSSGGLKWNHTIGGATYGSPALADVDGDGKLEITVGSFSSGTVFCFSGSGRVLWTYKAETSVGTSCVVADVNGDNEPEVLFGTVPINVGGKVHCITGKNGSQEWVFATGGEINSSPVVVDINGDRAIEVLVGASDSKLYCLGGVLLASSDVATPIAIVLVLVGLIIGVPFLLLGIVRRRRTSFGDREISVGVGDEAVRSAEDLTQLENHAVPAGLPNACPYCGVSLVGLGASFCWNCGASLSAESGVTVAPSEKKRPATVVGKCMVCNLEVSESQQVLWCPYCGNIAHRTHMLEWLHVKDYCPTCHKHLEERDLKDRPIRRRPKKHVSPKRQPQGHALLKIPIDRL